jgi:hypothetical protein
MNCGADIGWSMTTSTLKPDSDRFSKSFLALEITENPLLKMKDCL